MKLSELRKLAQNFPGNLTADAYPQIQQYIRQSGLDPNALYQELEMTSPFADTHRDISFNNAQVQLHSHRFYEILYCTNNCGAEYLVGPERFKLQQGDILFIPPGVSHRPVLPEVMTEPYRRYVLWLSTAFMEWYASLYPYPFTEKQASANMLRTGGTSWESLGDLFRAGVQEAEAQADGWEAAVIGNTVQLLTQIKRATDARSAKPLRAEKPELLDRITAYVEMNYHRPIVIADLSKRFYVSASTISHLFKQKLGVSFYRYITQRRLIAAKSLIETGELLENVAAKTGFLDYSGFYRAFKHEYGISPSEYRKINTSGT